MPDVKPTKNNVLFQKIWNEKNIAERSLLASFLVPLILVSLLMLIKLKFNPLTITPPYVLFFAVILISACYGGARAAICASLISFVAAIALLFIPMHLSDNLLITHLLEAIAFCIEALFLSFLIFYFQSQRKRNKNAALSMKAVNELLHMREKDHENFVHMAAHELKSPVTVLKGYMQMLEARLSDGEKDNEIKLLSKMDIQLNKLLKRINDLLDLAKVNGGAMQYNLANFNINNAVLHCIEDVRVANPDFLIEHDAMEESISVNGDKERIQQVVTNLLNNSIKYSGNEKYVKLTCQLLGTYVMIKVIDHGVGIPLDKQPFVFERFYRANQTNAADKPGLGLGLYICKEIIKQHRGEMGMVSQEGSGSIFWFKLPAQGI